MADIRSTSDRWGGNCAAGGLINRTLDWVSKTSAWGARSPAFFMLLLAYILDSVHLVVSAFSLSLIWVNEDMAVFISYKKKNMQIFEYANVVFLSPPSIRGA